MEKGSPFTTMYNEDDQQQIVPAQHHETTTAYETVFLPHISLPQRSPLANTAKHPGLLAFATQKSPAPCEDSSLTMAFSKHEITQSIKAAQQIQSAPTLASISATFTNRSADLQIENSHTGRHLQNFRLPQSIRRLVISPPNKRHSNRERKIEHARAQILLKTCMTLVLFTCVGGITWTVFSHMIIYLLILFSILAIMLGSILSNAINDYYQLYGQNIQTSTRFQAVQGSDLSNTLEGSHLHMPSDTSGHSYAPETF